MTVSAPPKTAPIPLNAAARRKQHERRREELEKQVIVARCGSCPDFFLRGPALDVLEAQIEHRREVHGIKSFKLRKPKPTAEAKPRREPAERKPKRKRERKVFDFTPVRALVITELRGGAVPGRELHPAVAEKAGCSIGQARFAARQLLREGVIGYVHKPPFLWRLA